MRVNASFVDPAGSLVGEQLMIEPLPPIYRVAGGPNRIREFELVFQSGTIAVYREKEERVERC